MVENVPLGLNLDLSGTDDAGLAALGALRPGMVRQIITAVDFAWLDKLTAAGKQHGFDVMLCLGGPFRNAGGEDEWREITARYPRVWCDLINEPQEAGWNDRAEALGRAVLEANPDARIAVQFPGTFYLTVPNMRRMPFPCTYSLHWYLDHNYTHQGISGRPAPLPYERRNYQYWLRWWAAPVIYWLAENRARVFVGEFSCNRAAPDCDTWLRDAMALFNALGWPWMYHAFRGAPYWNAESSPVWREIVNSF